ncbi:MaoC family dehydratase N-terminal domain-containing protein [Nocardia sp. NPDC057353]|uniref:FAS1-like dehydratase domain-containing protein n=1 Tax=Nocardia sp. NPDC057353 TaxID=3346104 RepID=UPI00363E49CE
MSWEPHTVVSEEYLDPGPVGALTALLGSGAPPVGVGDPLPPLWHWVALPRWPAAAETGSDGHPRRGSFLPPVELPRRMFAGGEVRFSGVLTVGETVRREARVLSVTPKQGRSGRLVAVVVEITLSGADGTVVERQDLLYREAAIPGTAPPPPTFEPVGAALARLGAGAWELRTDPVVLMRFSAATANAHRIHYDWPYATGVEGYPGLVVHGPLTTLALAETLRVDAPRPPVLLRHRNLAPIFCGSTIGLGPRSVPLAGEDGASDAPVRLGAPATPEAERTAIGADSTIHAVLTAAFAPPEPDPHA